MKKLLSSAALIALATGASAGGIERSSQSIGFLFDEGDVLSLGISHAKPDVSGVTTGPITGTPIMGGESSGDMAGDYTSFNLSYKQQVSDQLHFGIILDESVGADAAYPVQLYPLAGASAFVDGQAITGYVRYALPSNVSLIGGIRFEKVSGGVGNLPDGAGGVYNLATDESTETGFVLGVAYERPDIALRVALSYNSEITHTLNTTENGMPSGSMDVTTPKSWNLEFQSGVAKDTLVFGNIKWREWSAFDISPNGFALASGGASLVNLTNDSVTYNLGVGRRINDDLSVFASLGYEKANGGFAGNLTPSDGQRSISIGGSYNVNDNVTLRGGISYINIGDANVITTAQPSISSFTDNSAIGFGLQMKYSF